MTHDMTITAAGMLDAEYVLCSFSSFSVTGHRQASDVTDDGSFIYYR
jgi:hypothetical protein